MMGDPGTWDMTLLHSVPGNQRRDEFQGRAVPSFTGDPHLPSSSNDLHCEPPPYSQALGPDISDSGVLALGKFLRNPDEDGLAHSKRLQHKGSCKVVKESKSKKWNDSETSILLQCMVDGDRFCKGKRGAMDWNLISEEINMKRNGGPSRSKEQCQNRFDTLLKAYKDLSAFCVKSGKKFMEVTNDEIRGLKLATPLPNKHEGWYNDLCTIDDRRACLRGKFEKRQKLNMDGDIGINNSASCEQSLEPRNQTIPNVIGSLESNEQSSKQVAIPRFKDLEEELRCTLLNLIQVCSHIVKIWGHCNLEIACRMVACIQDQNPLVVRKNVYKLWDLKLLRFEEEDNRVIYCWSSNCWTDGNRQISSSLEVYKKFGKKVLNKNDHLNIIRRILSKDLVASKLFPLQQVRMLILHECEEVEEVDLENFPDLRCLDIRECAKLKVVRGWEVVKGLGWIDISLCESYIGFPKVQCLSSLKEFCFTMYYGLLVDWQLANFSQCSLLRSLHLTLEGGDESLRCVDLKGLKFLEALSIDNCCALSSLEGMSGQHALSKLQLSWCGLLRKVPNLNCMKTLTELNLNYSGIVEIPEVEELHLLTILEVLGCNSLKKLPFLGHLKVLAKLDISYTKVEEIPGIEGLVNLELLDCNGSLLKWLPSMHHLHRLRRCSIKDTPLEKTSLTWHLAWHFFIDELQRSKKVVVDDISDISDTEYNSSYED